MTLHSITRVTSALLMLVTWDYNKKICCVHNYIFIPKVSWHKCSGNLDEVEDCELKVLASKLPKIILHS